MAITVVTTTDAVLWPDKCACCAGNAAHAKPLLVFPDKKNPYGLPREHMVPVCIGCAKHWYAWSKLTLSKAWRIATGAEILLSLCIAYFACRRVAITDPSVKLVFLPLLFVLITWIAGVLLEPVRRMAFELVARLGNRDNYSASCCTRRDPVVVVRPKVFRLRNEEYAEEFRKANR